MVDSQHVALITGSARGLGNAIARRLAKAHCSIVICDVDRSAAERAAAELADRESSTTVVGLQADVSDETSVAAMFAEIERLGLALDIVVNNAGISGAVGGRKRPVEELSLADWQRILAVNLTGPFIVSRGAIPLMKRNKWGRIVNIASRSGRTLTSLNNGPYATSKAGLAGLSRSLAGELGPFGITVNCVAPSRVDTPLGDAEIGRAKSLQKNVEESPLGRLATAEDIANAVAFLCSTDADFITGAILDVNGGSFMAS